MFDYWDQPDELGLTLNSFIPFPGDDPAIPSFTTQVAPRAGRKKPSRSGSSDTIRPSRKNKSPPPSPRLSFIDLPPVPSVDESSSRAPSSNINGPFFPTRMYTTEKFRLQRSHLIHDDHLDLNFTYDYKVISLSNLKGHSVFHSIQQQLISSAYDMSLSDSKTRYFHPNGTPLLPRHVRSLARRHPDVYGDMQESYVALLELIALHCEDRIKIVSAGQLCGTQKAMYQEVASELERDMRAAYDRVRIR
ncbi:hypothetical protein C0991_000675 [Blastosporella zonata]|nr:hypothetical protein C0991_000675 [Blastosporella zonata]